MDALLPSYDLELAAARYKAGVLQVEAFPAIALAALEAGCNGAALCELALDLSPTRRDHAVLFERALQECSVAIPTHEEAVAYLRRRYLRTESSKGFDSAKAEWLSPWGPILERPSDHHQIISRELQFELVPGHELFGLPVELAAQGGGDDFLFQVTDGTGRVAVVHLTFKMGPETLPWPSTAIYESFQQFVEHLMIPDHEDIHGCVISQDE